MRGYDRLMPRFRRWHALPLVLLALAAVAGILYIIPSDHYVYLPDEARPADPLVRVPGDDDTNGEDSGIYMVDVIVRRASILERLFPGIDDGATLVPAADANPLGVSDRQRRQSSLQDMTRSQQIAAAVALRALGYKVQARPNGIEVNQVDPAAPAAGKLEIGDVIVRAGEKTIRTTTDLQTFMRSVEPGERVALTVQRGKSLEQVRVGTQASPQDRNRAIFGIIIQQDADITLPVKVSIDAGNVGGPSAGLAFALDIVDELGSDVDRGRTIVATGEIALDGAVGPIGGIKQKTIGARQAGADLFLVPVENAPEARKHAGDLKIVPVRSLRQALSILKTAT